MTALTITKLDVLQRHRPAAGRGPLPLEGGRGLRHASPTTSRSCTRPTPEYEELPGFDADIEGCRSEAELPPQARAYLDYISEFVGVPIRLVGVGPDRDQVVWIGDEPRLQAA